MKVAIFKSTEFDFETIKEKRYEENSDYVRISEYVDVEFPPLSQQEQVNAQLTILKAQKQAIQKRTAEQIAGIDNQISKLLALPPAEAE